MSDTTIIEAPLTIEGIARRLTHLEERLEDLEDLRELNEAIARNGGKPAIPWEQARAELGLDDGG